MRNITHRTPRGFSIPELMVVMLISGILSGLLLVMYTQSRHTLQRGVAKTSLQQKVRMASIRIIPKVTSTIWQPAGVNSSGVMTPLLPAIDYPVAGNTTPSEYIVLHTTKEFVDTQLRRTATEFNPRTPVYSKLRVFLKNRGIDPKAPELGDRVDVYIDENTPTNTTDDIQLASGLSKVTFTRTPNDTVRLRVEAKGYMPNATSGRSVVTETYETDVYLPVITNSGGT